MLKKLFLISIIFISAIYIGCDKKIIDPFSRKNYNDYVISKGKQSSTESVNAVTTTELTFLVTFDNSASYTTTDPNNQFDVNKLYGFSDCNKQHHEFSARFGWRWLNNKLEIHAYGYNNSIRTIKYMTTVDLNREYAYKIKIDGTKYTLTCNNITTTLDRGCNDNSTLRYLLYPFFGGTENAPHDIKIKIKEI